MRKHKAIHHVNTRGEDDEKHMVMYHDIYDDKGTNWFAVRAVDSHAPKMLLLMMTTRLFHSRKSRTEMATMSTESTAGGDYRKDLFGTSNSTHGAVSTPNKRSYCPSNDL